MRLYAKLTLFLLPVLLNATYVEWKTRILETDSRANSAAVVYSHYLVEHTR